MAAWSIFEELKHAPITDSFFHQNVEAYATVFMGRLLCHPSFANRPTE
jgi:hypothetical protein